MDESLNDFPKREERMDKLEKRFDALREDVKSLVKSLRGCEKELKVVKEDFALVKVLEGRIVALSSKVNGFDLQVKAFAGQFEEVDGKLLESAEMWATGKKGDMDMSGVEAAINQGFKDLINYKKAFEAKMDARRGVNAVKAPAQRAQPSEGFVEAEVLSDLMVTVDLSLLDVDVQPDLVTLKPKQFLGDLWSPIMDIMRTMGGEWIRDGKDSRWEIRRVGAPSTQQPSQRSKPQIRDPDSPATEKQIALLRKMKVFVKPNLTKGEASTLINTKIAEQRR